MGGQIEIHIGKLRRKIFQFRLMGPLVANLDVSHYQKSQEWLPLALPLKIETCNGNQAKLNLGQSSN